jgi:hypothetical protein
MKTWDKIYNPKTGRFVNVNGRVGKKILRHYMMLLSGGSGTDDTTCWNSDSQCPEGYKCTGDYVNKDKSWSMRYCEEDPDYVAPEEDQDDDNMETESWGRLGKTNVGNEEKLTEKKKLKKSSMGGQKLHGCI